MHVCCSKIERMQEKFFIQKPLIKLCLGYIGMDLVINELYYKGTILKRNYWKMTISWSSASLRCGP